MQRAFYSVSFFEFGVEINFPQGGKAKMAGTAATRTSKKRTRAIFKYVCYFKKYSLSL